MSAKLIQLSRSSGGMPKLAIPSAHITVDGVPEDWQLNRIHPQLLKAMLGHSGWVARVITPGQVNQGDPVRFPKG